MMLVSKKFTILKHEIGQTFCLNYSNYNKIMKNKPKLQVQHMRKTEYILGISPENNCVNRQWWDDEY